MGYRPDLEHAVNLHSCFRSSGSAFMRAVWSQKIAGMGLGQASGQASGPGQGALVQEKCAQTRVFFLSFFFFLCFCFCFVLVVFCLKFFFSV